MSYHEETRNYGHCALTRYRTYLGGFVYCSDTPMASRSGTSLIRTTSTKLRPSVRKKKMSRLSRCVDARRETCIPAFDSDTHSWKKSQCNADEQEADVQRTGCCRGCTGIKYAQPPYRLYPFATTPCWTSNLFFSFCLDNALSLSFFLFASLILHL